MEVVYINDSIKALLATLGRQTSGDYDVVLADPTTAALGGRMTMARLAEVISAKTPSMGVLTSVYSLEQSSSPAFDIAYKGAAEIYIGHMGGYGIVMNSGKAYAAKLNGDWTGFMDGTPITDVSKFEWMIHVPKCHFKGNGQTMNFGGIIPVDGGQVFDSPEWVGAFEMYVDGSSVGHSRPNVAPSHSRTMSAFDTCAKNNGSAWGQANYGFHCLINALFQARYGNLNSQSVIGAGGQTSAWDSWRDVPMGLTKSLGDGSGSVHYNDATVGDQYEVKLFGFEGLWGKLWEFRPGIRFYMDGETRKAVVYGGNQVSNSASGREFACMKDSAYPKNMVLGEHWDMIPLTGGGGTSTYYCDYGYAESGGELLAVGGLAFYGANCGLSYSRSNPGFSYSDTSLGSRLAFYGQPQIVSGAELLAMTA